MIKRFFRKLRRKISSLRVRFLVVFFLSLILAVGLYLIADTVAVAFIDNVYIAEENKKEREKNYLADLQKFINENEISSEETGLISKWARENQYVYLLIYKDNEIFFTSDDVPTDSKDEVVTPPEDDPPEQTPDSSAGSTANGAESGGGNDDDPGGITVQYPTREELLEYAKKNEMHLIELEDGPLFASFAEFTEYLYYDIANVASLIAAALVVALIMLIYIKSVTGRIIRLGMDVNRVAAGDTESRIPVSGNDEIAELATNVESMRSSIVENYKKEKEALDANTALITSMSHDIRTPLTVLLGYMDVMRIHAGDDELMQGYIKAAESTAMRLKKLSDDMFGYFLVFGGKDIKVDPEKYDAETLIEQMLAEHILLMNENGYVLELDGIETNALSGKSVTTDAQSLVRIFDNAFSNIYKYADKKKPVRISVSADACNIIIGFSNFIRKDGEKVESNGIGLKTCKKLAELINAGFEYGGDDSSFDLKLSLKYE